MEQGVSLQNWTAQPQYVLQKFTLTAQIIVSRDRRELTTKTTLLDNEYFHCCRHVSSTDLTKQGARKVYFWEASELISHSNCGTIAGDAENTGPRTRGRSDAESYVWVDWSYVLTK